MPGSGLQKHGGEKLPGVRVVDATIAQGKIITDKASVVILQQQLRNENCDVCADESHQNDPLLLGPAPCERRGFSSGKAHLERVS